MRAITASFWVHMFKRPDGIWIRAENDLAISTYPDGDTEPITSRNVLDLALYGSLDVRAVETSEEAVLAILGAPEDCSAGEMMTPKIVGGGPPLPICAAIRPSDQEAALEVWESGKELL